LESESYGGRKKVEFVIPEEETAALDWAALRIVGPRGYDIGPGLMNADLNTTLHLDVIATEEDARTVATEIYARIRELGRLPAAPDPQISLVALVAGVPVDADETSSRHSGSGTSSASSWRSSRPRSTARCRCVTSWSLSPRTTAT
jgi:hypothetical protein